MQQQHNAATSSNKVSFQPPVVLEKSFAVTSQGHEKSPGTFPQVISGNNAVVSHLNAQRTVGFLFTTQLKNRGCKQSNRNRNVHATPQPLRCIASCAWQLKVHPVGWPSMQSFS